MKIVFCMPGRSWGEHFLSGAFETISILSANGVQIVGSAHHSPLVAAARNMCVGGSSAAGPIQKPFLGKLNYDYLLWIDSDQCFTFLHFAKLMERKRDICSGWYKTITGNSSVCIKANDDEFQKIGEYKLMHPKEVEAQKAPFKADFVGFGFVLIKQGVFEKIKYPWFSHDEITMHNGVVRQVGEDVSFCRKAREAGFSIWVDPEVHVGHTKEHNI